MYFNFQNVFELSQRDKNTFEWFLDTNCISNGLLPDTHVVFWLSDKYDNIMTMFTALFLDNDVVEIYNVCTKTTFRRLGYANKLFNLFFTNFPRYQFWVGVDPKNRIAIRLYEKLRFSVLEVTHITPSGYYSKQPFVAMIR